MVVFKMRESVPIARYSPVCNVLRQWKTSLILTYRVYRLYDTDSMIYIIMMLWLYRFITDYIIVYYMYTCMDKTMQIVLERGSIDA